MPDGRAGGDVKKLNTEDHFQIGGKGEIAKVTVHQDEYRKDVANRNKIFHKTNQ